MQRLAKFDVTSQFTSPTGKLVAQILFALLCSAAMISVRSGLDLVAPTSGPFALVYPTVLLVTLYGHWQAGVTTLALTFIWAWFFVLPNAYSFTFVDTTDPARVAINAFCCLIVILFAEAFRRASRSSVNEMRKTADRRLILLTDLEHRTKNNFALVASMLELQKRTLNDPTLQDHLNDAAGRIRTFADAYADLAFEQEDEMEVEARYYLNALLDRLEDAAIPENVRLFREIDHQKMPRETAAAIGLYLNEAISNALKYAFPEGRDGTIGVLFHASENGWQITVEDDGDGIDSAGQNKPGLGSRLMEAFAHQAGAKHGAGPTLAGFRSEMVYENMSANA